MAIPNGVIFMWDGLNSNIPAGWQRVTSLDGKYPRVVGPSDTVNTTGGSATHFHTSPSHTHNIAAHTHTFTISGFAGGSSTGGNGGNPGINRDHNHGLTTSGAVANSSTSSVAVTYSAISNDPPFYTVIFITPTTYASGLNTNILAYMDGTDPKAFTVCDGNNSTIDLRNKFMKGAGTGLNGGGTGGSTTNTHNIDHTHTNSHIHSAATTGTASGYVGINSADNVPRNTHTHSVTLNTTTITSNTNSSIGSQSETVLPPYVNLMIVQNKTANPLIQEGVMGFWLGSEASVPRNWEVQTKYGKLIRNTDTSNVGSTGGSETHTHAAQSHTHTTPAHTHTTPDIYHTAQDLRDSTGDTAYARPDSYHPATTTSSSSPNLEAANTTADSANNMPEYRNVFLIKYLGQKGGGFLFNLLR